MSDERLDRELGEIFRAAADVELPDSLMDRVASIPARRPVRRGVAREISRFAPAVGTTGLRAAALMLVLAIVAGATLFGAWRHGQTVTIATPTASATLSPGSSSTPSLGPEPSSTSAVSSVPVPGTFSPTGSMASGRHDHSATVLADGRVLIAGGQDTSNELASAELYDPKTGTFSPTGSMTTARMDHTATRLPDGRVLIAGGLDSSGYLASAELYDPHSGTFSPTGSMATARYGHTATLLSDGRVLIVGGFVGHTAIPTPLIDVPATLASAELYDPATATFTRTGSMATARGSHTATLLSDGRVLVAGGQVATGALGDNTFASAELYDPGTGGFSPTGSMSTGRVGHTATLLTDGRVLIAGGRGAGMSGSGSPFASAELYDARTGKFSATGSMTTVRREHTATLLSDGRVLIAGGTDASERLASAELYDPHTGAFSPTGSTTDARYRHAAALLPDGRVLITGGYGPTTPANPALASAEVFEP
jgi:hypothetical protein